MKKVIIALSLLLVFCATDMYGYGMIEKQKQFMITGQLGFDVPMGDWGENWANGYGFQASLEMIVTPEISIGAHTGYIYWDPPTELPSGYENTYFAIPLCLQLLYYFPKTSDFTSYLGLEGGYYFTGNSIKNPITSSTTSNDNPGGGIVFGLYMPFYEGIFLNANAKYTLIFAETSMSYFGINAGFSYQF